VVSVCCVAARRAGGAHARALAAVIGGPAVGAEDDFVEQQLAPGRDKTFLGIGVVEQPVSAVGVGDDAAVAGAAHASLPARRDWPALFPTDPVMAFARATPSA